MSAEKVYDPIDNQWLTWKPLREGTMSIRRSLGDQGIMKIGAFGTCGNPKDPGYSSWREESLFPVLEEHGLNAEADVSNPEVEIWTPLRAPVEGIWMARNEVIVVASTNDTDSPAGITETGFAAYGGVLRGQDVITFIQSDENSPPSTAVARKLATSVLEATASLYPYFHVARDLGVLANRAAISLVNRKQHQHSGAEISEVSIIPTKRDDLVPEIYLSGTSGKEKPQWMAEVGRILGSHNVGFNDSYRDDWVSSSADEELMYKLNSAVHLIAITGETESLGALAELGPRIMYGDLAGQSIGVYIERHASSSETSPSNRTRILALEHLRRLREDFPGIPVFIAPNLGQLAIFGLSEYYQRQASRNK